MPGIVPFHRIMKQTMLPRPFNVDPQFLMQGRMGARPANSLMGMGIGSGGGFEPQVYQGTLTPPAPHTPSLFARPAGMPYQEPPALPVRPIPEPVPSIARGGTYLTDFPQGKPFTDSSLQKRIPPYVTQEPIGMLHGPPTPPLTPPPTGPIGEGASASAGAGANAGWAPEPGPTGAIHGPFTPTEIQLANETGLSKLGAMGTGWKAQLGLGFGSAVAGDLAAQHLSPELAPYARTAGNAGSLGAGLVPTLASKMGIAGVGGVGGLASGAIGATLAHGFSATPAGNEYINAVRGASDNPLANAAAMLNPLKAITSVGNILTDNKLFGRTNDTVADLATGGTGGPNAQQGQPAAPPPPPVRDANALTKLMTEVKLSPDMQAKVIDDYQMNIALAREGGGVQVADPDNPGKSKTSTDPKDIEAAAWQSSLQMIPMLKQSQGDQEDFTRRTTAMQAGLEQAIPGLLTQGNYADPGKYGQAAAGLQMIPGMLAMGEYADQNRQMASQIQQARQMQMMQLTNPELFKSHAATGASDPALAALNQ